VLTEDLPVHRALIMLSCRDGSWIVVGYVHKHATAKDGIT